MPSIVVKDDCRTAEDALARAAKARAWRTEALRPTAPTVTRPAPAAYKPARKQSNSAAALGAPVVSPRPLILPNSIQEIIVITADHFGLRSAWMYSGRQPWKIGPRRIAIYIAHEKAGKSLPAIGRVFCRDHTTMLAHIRKIKLKLAAGDTQLAATIEEIAEKVRHHEIPATEQAPLIPRNKKRPYSADDVAMPRNDRRPYSEFDEALLTRLYVTEGRRLAEIANAMGRTVSGIEAKVTALHLRRANGALPPFPS